MRELYTHWVCSAYLAIIGFSSDENKRKLFMDEINMMKRVSVGNNPHVLKMTGSVTTTLPVMLHALFIFGPNDVFFIAM